MSATEANVAVVPVTLAGALSALAQALPFQYARNTEPVGVAASVNVAAIAVIVVFWLAVSVMYSNDVPSAAGRRSAKVVVPAGFELLPWAVTVPAAAVTARFAVTPPADAATACAVAAGTGATVAVAVLGVLPAPPPPHATAATESKANPSRLKRRNDSEVPGRALRCGRGARNSDPSSYRSVLKKYGKLPEFWRTSDVNVVGNVLEFVNCTLPTNIPFPYFAVSFDEDQTPRNMVIDWPA